MLPLLYYHQASSFSCSGPLASDGSIHLHHSSPYSCRSRTTTCIGFDPVWSQWQWFPNSGSRNARQVRKINLRVQKYYLNELYSFFFRCSFKSQLFLRKCWITSHPQAFIEMSFLKGNIHKMILCLTNRGIQPWRWDNIQRREVGATITFWYFVVRMVWL